MHPVILAIWFALSSVFVQYMKWWPNPQLGWSEYLKILPGFAAMAVPVMFFVDWWLLFLNIFFNYADFV